MTEIVCILDRSGSMGNMANEVINSFNYFIQKQKELPGTSTQDKLTLVLFDDNYEVVHDKIYLLNTPKLTSSTYYVRGMTSLNDAICKAVNNIDKSSKNVIVLIQTDGQENSSKEFTTEYTKKLIKEKELLGWEFNFVGAGLDAFKNGETFGLRNNIYVNQDSYGVQKSFDFFTQQCINYRNVSMGKEPVTKKVTTEYTFPGAPITPTMHRKFGNPYSYF